MRYALHLFDMAAYVDARRDARVRGMTQHEADAAARVRYEFGDF